MTEQAKLEPQLRSCVVCGAQSHRDNWLHRKTVGATLFVACDHHSGADLEKAVVKATGASAAKPN